jgi:glycosyltransferase involved in cell wall biosynthesis
MQRKRVLILGDGTSVHTKKWIQGLAQANLFELHLISMHPNPIDAEIQSHPGLKSARKISPQRISEKGGNYRYLLELPRLHRAVKEIQPDLISTLYLTSYGFMGALLKGRARLVHFALGTDVMVSAERSRAARTAIAFALRRADHVISVSRTMTERLKARFGFPEEKILTRIYGVSEEVLHYPRAGTKDFDFVSNRMWIANSNIDYILEILGAWPKARLALVGQPIAGSEALSQKIEQTTKGMAGCECMGALPYMRNIDVVARSRFLVSLTSSDGASLSLLEGMAVGAVPLVSDIPPNREWIEPGRNGFLVPLDDVEGARKIFSQALSLSEAERQAMATNAHAVVEMRGAFNKNMAMIAELMRDLTSFADSKASR